MTDNNPVRILYIEDDEGCAILFKKRMERAGYIVDLAYSGEEGLSIFKQGFHDVLILDYRMTGMSGIEMLKLLSSRGPLPPTILVTGFADTRVAIEALKLGASDYVMKDAEVNYLDLMPAVIEQTLQHHRLAEEKKKAEEALRESEERFRLLFEQSNDAILIHDLGGKIIDVNFRACEMMGMTETQLCELTMRDLHEDTELETYEKKLRETLQKGHSLYESLFKLADGNIIEVEISSRIASKEKGIVQAIVRNLTYRRRMEAELAKIERLESLGILAGGIAHDFNNILSGIIGNLSLAKLEVDENEPLSDYLNGAIQASLQARNLSQQLLTFSKGGTPIKKIGSIGKLLMDATQFALVGSNIKVKYSIPDDLWKVEMDEGQMGQVINNVVLNAQQAMPAGGTIWVTAENITVNEDDTHFLKKGKYVKFSIRDQGIGIPKENLQRIFDPFFTTKQKGSGLGLATAFSIMKKHGGHITVESELGNGATFYFYLPATLGVEKKATENKDELRHGRGKILLMDDEEIVRTVACRMLTLLGYEVIPTRDGKEAIEQYKMAKDSNEPFTAVIMDLTVPGGIGGKEAIEELIKIDPNVKAIVSSGYSNDPIMANFKKYNFVGFLPKPYKIKELSDVLYSVIGEK